MRLPRLELPAVAGILAVLFGAIAYPLSDHDYFWHLKTGYLILESGTIPTRDPYSFTAEGVPWEVQGWLFDLAMAWVHRASGDSGLRVFFVLWIVATWAAVQSTVRLYIRDAARALPVTLVSAAGASMYFVARPLVATLLGFALTLFLLLKHRRSGRQAWLLGIPVVMAIWVNLHFGFITGLGLIALVFVSDILSRAMPINGAPVERGRLKSHSFVVLVGGSLLALGANPSGYGALTTMAQMTQAGTASAVVEWLSPDFHLPGPQVFLLPVALAILAHALGRSRPDWVDLVLLLAMTGGALYSMRHMPLAAIALAPVIARGFASWTPIPWRNRWLSCLPNSVRRRGADDLGDRTHALNLLLCSVAALAILAARPVVDALQVRRLIAAVPVEATNFLESRQVLGPILNEYSAGGYLIWRLHPRGKVFIDGRYTLYPSAVINDYFRITHLKEGWLGVLDERGIQAILARDPKSGFVQALLGTGRFRLVHADAHFGVLIRIELDRPDLPDVRLH